MARSKRTKGFFKSDGFWHLRTDPVTKRKLTTKCRDIESALEFRKERERIANAPPELPSEKATLGEWIAKYWRLKQQSNVALATISCLEGKLGTVLRILGEARRLATITPGTIDWYVEQRRAEGVSDNTIRREIREIVNVLKLAKRADCYPLDLQALMPMTLDAKYRPRERSLTVDEVSALLDSMPTPRARAFVALIVALGCRRSEVLRLRREDIEMQVVKDADGTEKEQLLVWIDGRKTEGANRVVPVLSAFVPLLKSALDELPVVVIWNPDRMFKLACKRAGIERCSANDLRRTHATLVGEKGVTDEQIAKLLGHTTVTMAKRVYNRTKALKLAPTIEGILAQSDPIEFPKGATPTSRKAPGRSGAKRERCERN
jgi:integrase